MLIGYARVSTPSQNLDLQTDALTQCGCERIFTDVASGAKTQRPSLDEMLDFLRAGDTLIVWKLDRLGRSLSHLVHIITALGARQINFRSLTESIDSSTTMGKFIYHICSSLAELERSIILERTSEGLAAARARGRKGGRKMCLTADKLTMLKTLAADKGNSVRSIYQTLGISRASFYNYLKTTTSSR